MDLRPKLSVKYPENSLQSQCGDFAHRLIEFPSVGNWYSQKKKAVQLYGILRQNLTEFRIGDVLICSDGTWAGIGAGHVAVVANLDTDSLYLAESNYKNDGRVHYGRKLAKTDPRIYGVLRGKFLINLGLTTPLILKTTILMQYEKQWDSTIFQKLTDKMLELSGGKIKLDIYPEYTFKSLKNWWYQEYPFGNFQYSVIAYQFFKENVLPLIFPDSQIVLWSINKQQWEGTVAGTVSYPELGWTYFPYCQHTITCEEQNKSFRYPDEDAFIHYATHEISHGLSYWGRADGDNKNYLVDLYDTSNNREEVFMDIDYDHLRVNLC